MICSLNVLVKQQRFVAKRSGEIMSSDIFLLGNFALNEQSLC